MTIPFAMWLKKTGSPVWVGLFFSCVDLQPEIVWRDGRGADKFDAAL
jgi:hypothetical protein